MKTLHTFTVSQDEYSLTVTQDYDETFNSGHWRLFIEKDGHVLYILESGSGPPKGKITSEWASEMLYERVDLWKNEEYLAWKKEQGNG